MTVTGIYILYRHILQEYLKILPKNDSIWNILNPLSNNLKLSLLCRETAVKKLRLKRKYKKSPMERKEYNLFSFLIYR